MSGVFISFEGGEGAGKTTQIKLLAQRLQAQGSEVLTTREPGGTSGAEAIRALILNQESFAFSELTEALLFFAARRDHIEKVILPSLACGAIVLCDRFTDSTFAYQGALGKLALHIMHTLAKLVQGDLQPDLTFVLDIDPKIGLHRAALRRGNAATDRFESENLAFHMAIRKQFLEIAKAQPQRCVVLQAEQDQEILANQIFEHVAQKLGVQ